MAARPFRAAGALSCFGVTSLLDDAVDTLPPHTARVSFRDVSAVVAGAPDGHAGLDLDRYREVVEGVFAGQAILPAPPGTVFRSRDVLAQWLELHYFTLVDALAFVDERVAVRLHVRLAALPDQGGEDGRDAVDGSLLFDAIRRETQRVLRRHAVACVAVPVEDAAAGLTFAYLVERERLDVFGEVVRTEAGRHPALEFTLSGPWPPYDFVRMDFGG